MYTELAKELKKTIILYYGAAGHRRGLVDGMPSWGVKNPLRKQIIISDFYWTLAADLVKMFYVKGFHTEDRDYSELTTEYIQSFRTVKARPLAGCTKLHMIAFHPDGSVGCKQDICDCVMCFSGEFQKSKYEHPETNDEDDIDIDNEVNNDEDGYGEDDDYDGDDADRNAHFETLCEMIQPGQIIALRHLPRKNRVFTLLLLLKW